MSDTDARLQGLYPHLQEARAGLSDEDLVHSAVAKARDSAALKQAWFEAHADALVAMAREIAAVYAAEGRVFTMGNGGSACDAQHFAVEFTHPVTVGRPSLPAVFLGDDIAHLTAIGNDVGFQHVFVRRLLALARSGDGLVAFSTSGNSANLLGALRQGRELGLRTFALLGNDGGRIAADALADHCLVVPGDSIHRIQEVHVAIYHVLWDLVHTVLPGVRAGAAAP